MDNLRGLSEEFRLAYGAGIVLMMGNIARLELNYVVPVRAQTGDRWEREKDRDTECETERRERKRQCETKRREREQKRERKREKGERQRGEREIHVDRDR